MGGKGGKVQSCQMSIVQLSKPKVSPVSLVTGERALSADQPSGL